MAANKRFILTEMKSREEYLSERKSYTNAQAKKLGYASAKMLKLSDRLREIAEDWRDTKANHLVIEYGVVLKKMVDGGYDINTLPIQDQLPKDHMPNFESTVRLRKSRTRSSSKSNSGQRKTKVPRMASAFRKRARKMLSRVARKRNKTSKN